MKKKKPSKANSAVANRIVGAADVDPATIRFHKKNWRQHSPKQAAAVEGITREVGWVQRVIVNRRTGTLIDGHLRVALAQKRGDKTVPVSYIDVSKDEESKILISLDASSRMAGSNDELLASLIKGAKFEQPAARQFATDLLDDLDLDDVSANEKEKPEVAFTEELLEEHNFVVLYFDNAVDWTNAESIFDLKTVKSLHSRANFKQQGVGRVLRGSEAIAKIQAAAKHGR